MSDTSPSALSAFQAAMCEHRKAAGLSPEDAARLLGVTRQRVGQIEGGKHAPSLTKAEAVARVFGMELHEFLEFGKKTLAQSGEGH